MKKRYVLFDLDGTLTDSGEGITKSVAYALEYYGIHEENLEKLRCFIGPPLTDSFMEHYGFSREQAKEAIEKYRERYSTVGIFENNVYEGIPRLLQRLREAGMTLIVATSKPVYFARQILEHFDLAKYFDDIQGSEMDGVRDDKAEVIAYALEQNGVEERSQVVMIGDRRHDVIGAHKCGLEAIGVLYGFGSREELEQHGADAIAETVEDIAKILCEII